MGEGSATESSPVLLRTGYGMLDGIIKGNIGRINVALKVSALFGRLTGKNTIF